MPIRYEWLEPQLLVRVIYEGTLTVEDINGLCQYFLALFDATDHLIYGLHDVEGIRSVPPFLPKNFPYFRQIVQHPRYGFVAIVNISPIVSFWVKLLGKTFGLPYAVFPTPAEGETFLREMIRIAAGS